MLSFLLIVTLLVPRRRIDASAVDGSSSRVRAQNMHESRVAVTNVKKQSVSAKK
jgi:hypothetical protein